MNNIRKTDLTGVPVSVQYILRPISSTTIPSGVSRPLLMTFFTPEPFRQVLFILSSTVSVQYTLPENVWYVSLHCIVLHQFTNVPQTGSRTRISLEMTKTPLILSSHADISASACPRAHNSADFKPSCMKIVSCTSTHFVANQVSPLSIKTEAVCTPTPHPQPPITTTYTSPPKPA